MAEFISLLLWFGLCIMMHWSLCYNELRVLKVLYLCTGLENFRFPQTWAAEEGWMDIWCWEWFYISMRGYGHVLCTVALQMCGSALFSSGHVAENREKIRKGKWFCLTNPNPVCSDWSFPAFWLVSCKLELPLSTSLSLGFLPHTRGVFLSFYLGQTRVLFTINPLPSLWAQCWRAQLNTLTF